MTSLTKVAQTVKKIGIMLLFFLVVIVFLVIIFRAVKGVIQTYQPAPTPLVTTTFGKVPAITFPPQTFPKDIKFTIETISGRLPEASPTAKIYFLPKKRQGLLSNIAAKNMAEGLSINTDPTTVDKKLVFSKENKKLTIDPVTNNFDYQYDYLHDGSVFLGEKKLAQNEIVATANSFLTKLSALSKDYQVNNATVTFLTFNGTEFIPMGKEENQLNATCARVNFFRNPIEGIPVVTPKYNQGNIYLIVSKTQEVDKQVIKAEKYDHQISYENLGIYPLKTIETAWQEFISGNGYIAQAGESTFTKKAVIRDAFLAYYESNEEQTYLLPVFVFVGDKDFIGYTDALSSDWLIK